MAVTVAVKPRPRAAIKLPRNVACMVPSLNRSEIVGGAGGTRTRTWDTPKRILRPHGFVQLRPPACTVVGFKPSRLNPVFAAIRPQSPALASKLASRDVRFLGPVLWCSCLAISSGTALIMGDGSSPLASSREDPHGQTQLPHMVHCRILRPGNGLGTALSLKARILVQSHPNPSSSGWHHPWTRTISASALTTSGWMRGGLALQVVCSEVAWLVDRQISAARQLN